MGLKLRFKRPEIPATTAFVKKSKEELQEQQAKAVLAKVSKPEPAPLQRALPQKKGKKYYRVHKEWTVSKYRCTWVFQVGHEVEVLERSNGFVLVNFYPNTLTLSIAEELLSEHCEVM